MVEKSNVKFRSDDVEEYTSVDTFAVLSVVAGVVSCGAFISNVFLLFSLIAVCCGLASFLRIYRADGILSGKALATIGISLGLMFAVFQLSYEYERDRRIHNASRIHAETWLEYVRQGKLSEAHQLGKGFFQREVPGTDLEKHYSPIDIEDRLKQLQGSGDLSLNVDGSPLEQRTDFFERPILQKIIKLGEKGKIEFIRTLTSARESKDDYVSHEFELVSQESGKEVREKFDVTMKRSEFSEPFGVHWAVDMIDQEYYKVNRHRNENKK